MPPEENASVHDSLTATIDAIEKVEVATPATVAPVATEEQQASDTAKPDALAAREGRDAKGKFVKKNAATTDTPAHIGRPDAPDAKAAPVGAEAPAATDASGSPVPTTETAPAADAAPPSWKDGLKEKWGSLDPDVRSEISRREREITTGLQRAAETRKFGDSILQEFAPYAEVLQKEGATPQAAVRALLETSYTLRYGSREHKTALFQAMANQYGIDLNAQVDPEKANLQREIDSRRIEEARQGSQQQSNLQQEVAGEIQAFVDSPGHEHYETVRPVMAGLLGSGVAKTLQEAYDRACWADPTVRTAMQQAENLKRVAEQAKNRNALATVNGAPGGAVTPAASDAKDLRSFIASQFESGGGRV